VIVKLFLRLAICVAEFLGELKYRILKAVFRKQIVRNINGSKMILSFDDTGICKDLIIHGKREPFSTDRMKTFVGKSDTIIDIGANVGYYALLESRIASSGKIYAVEPVPANLELLKKNIELNGYSNLEVFHYGISDRNTTEEIYFMEKSNLSTFIKPTDGVVKDIIRVPMITLDDFIARHVKRNPDLLRMDVEGYEYNIFKGAGKLLSGKDPLKIFIEIESGLLSKDKLDYIVNSLKDNGFTVDSIYWEVPYLIGFYQFNKVLSNKLNKDAIRFKQGYVGDSYEKLAEAMRMFGWLDCFFVRK